VVAYVVPVGDRPTLPIAAASNPLRRIEVDCARVRRGIKHLSFELGFGDSVAQHGAEYRGGQRHDPVFAHPGVVGVEEDLVNQLCERVIAQSVVLRKSTALPQAKGQFVQCQRPGR